jgi:DsbC/DsbD-like thiol-disulfide interchange protein
MTPASPLKPAHNIWLVLIACGIGLPMAFSGHTLLDARANPDRASWAQPDAVNTPGLVRVVLQGRDDSATKVKGKIEGGAPDAKGVQTVKITLTIEKGWHIYGNPVDNEGLENNRTTVNFPKEIKVTELKYPKPMVHKDKIIGDHNIYEGTVVITATIQRDPASKDALPVNVKVNACNDTKCLPDGTLKLMLK